MAEMLNYTFTYYGWIKSYGDFDQDWFTINALSLEDAWSKVRRMKLFSKSEVTLDCINGKKVEESLRKAPAIEQIPSNEEIEITSTLEPLQEELEAGEESSF